MTIKVIKQVSANVCACVKCGNSVIYNKQNQWCRKCYDHDYNTTRRDKDKERRRSATNRENDFENYVLARTKAKAKKECRKFNLDLAWITSELAKGKCSVTNMPFVRPAYQPGKKGIKGAWSPSIDRIDNSKGYTKANCRIVVWMYNLAKNNYRDIDMVKMSVALTANLVMKAKGNNTNDVLVQQLRGMHAGLSNL